MVVVLLFPVCKNGVQKTPKSPQLKTPLTIRRAGGGGGFVWVLAGAGMCGCNHAARGPFCSPDLIQHNPNVGQKAGPASYTSRQGGFRATKLFRGWSVRAAHGPGGSPRGSEATRVSWRLLRDVPRVGAACRGVPPENGCSAVPRCRGEAESSR